MLYERVHMHKTNKDSFAAGTIDGPGAFDFTQGTGITGTPVTGDTSAVLHY